MALPSSASSYLSRRAYSLASSCPAIPFWSPLESSLAKMCFRCVGSCFRAFSVPSLATNLAIGSAARRAPPCTAGKTLFFFRRSNLQRAHDFYEKYGGRAVILARFVPIVRTFCPPVAGAARMSYSTYLVYDIFGGTLWISSMLLGGYIAGSRIPNVGQYIHFIIAGVILLSILPPIIGILRTRRAAGRTVRPPEEAPVPEAHSK